MSELRIFIGAACLSAAALLLSAPARADAPLPQLDIEQLCKGAGTNDPFPLGAANAHSDCVDTERGNEAALEKAHFPREIVAACMAQPEATTRAPAAVRWQRPSGYAFVYVCARRATAAPRLTMLVDGFGVPAHLAVPICNKLAAESVDKLPRVDCEQREWQFYQAFNEHPEIVLSPYWDSCLARYRTAEGFQYGYENFWACLQGAGTSG